MAGTTPRRTKAGRKHRPSGASARMPAARALAAAAERATRRWSRARRLRDGASAAPVDAPRTAARAKGASIGSSAKASQASAGSAPSRIWTDTARNSSPSGPPTALATASTASCQGAPPRKQAARRSTATGRSAMSRARLRRRSPLPTRLNDSQTAAATRRPVTPPARPPNITTHNAPATPAVTRRRMTSRRPDALEDPSDSFVPTVWTDLPRGRARPTTHANRRLVAACFGGGPPNRPISLRVEVSISRGRRKPDTAAHSTAMSVIITSPVSRRADDRAHTRPALKARCPPRQRKPLPRTIGQAARPHRQSEAPRPGPLSGGTLHTRHRVPAMGQADLPLTATAGPTTRAWTLAMPCTADTASPPMGQGGGALANLPLTATAGPHTQAWALATPRTPVPSAPTPTDLLLNAKVKPHLSPVRGGVLHACHRVPDTDQADLTLTATAGPTTRAWTVAASCTAGRHRVFCLD